MNDEGRNRMLTVGKLIEYLKTCNPDACVLAYEINSDAYIEQLPELPNMHICTVTEDREMEREHLQRVYRGDVDAEKKIESKLSTIYRYAKDDDVVINF